jgi:hypothetical protein
MLFKNPLFYVSFLTRRFRISAISDTFCGAFRPCHWRMAGGKTCSCRQPEICMFDPAELAVLRRAYARQVLFQGRASNAALENAFATVEREKYLGPGPWPIARWPRGYSLTPDADPAWLYADILVGILPERSLNNGQPSAHATWISAVDPKPGEHLVHIGAGVGYYTAIMAMMVGEGGKVTAIEFDDDLARRAAANLFRIRPIFACSRATARSPHSIRPTSST